MTLIKSISGMRGTIGGQPGTNLTPIDIVSFTSAYGKLVLDKNKSLSVVVGRDGRVTGPQVSALVCNTLLMMGIDVIDLGLSTTPTVEMEVMAQNAGGGIIITASHNPMSYNALKFLKDDGEFIDAASGQKLLDIASKAEFSFAKVTDIGKMIPVHDAIERHVKKIEALPIVDASLVRSKQYSVVVDCINSTGALALPILCRSLGVKCTLINEEINGTFAHNPEPLAHNLTQLSEAVLAHKADMGIALDPDVDRLAFMDENGDYCGEEYTLVMVADYILSQTPGATVSNLSSTKALRDITEKRGQQYYAAAVGEVNVVTKMKAVNAIIGGEGNGGIIYPTLHAGRDALVGIAILLTALAKGNTKLSTYRAQFPEYKMKKDKIQLTPELDVDHLLNTLEEQYNAYETDTQDGVKIYIDEGWVHMRKSNTEPIIRIYTEGPSEDAATAIAERIKASVAVILK